LSNNTINRTNEFVKRIILDPRDEAKRPTKTKHEERTQEGLKWMSSAENSGTG